MTTRQYINLLTRKHSVKKGFKMLPHSSTDDIMWYIHEISRKRLININLPLSIQIYTHKDITLSLANIEFLGMLHREFFSTR